MLDRVPVVLPLAETAPYAMGAQVSLCHWDDCVVVLGWCGVLLDVLGDDTGDGAVDDVVGELFDGGGVLVVQGSSGGEVRQAVDGGPAGPFGVTDRLRPPLPATAAEQAHVCR